VANALRLILPLIALPFLIVTVVGAGQVPTTTPAQRIATIFGVGDVVYRGLESRADETGRLMERLLDQTPNSRGILLGDNCNDDGTEECFERLDATSWGRLNARLFPVPGNHDYLSDAIMPFHFLYWVNAGALGLGYEWFDWGGWRVFALNSELMERTSNPIQRDRREKQMAWLERELARVPENMCTAAYFHRPPFSSGDNASPAWTGPLFRKLYKWGVDFYLAGHEHFFSYLPPLNPDGIVDRSRGIEGVIAGTGGAVFHADPRVKKPRDLKWRLQGEALLAYTLGVVRLDLQPGKFAWEFIPVTRQTGFRYPSGSGVCHDRPRGYVELLDFH
jgi:acid phosphatase type 7